MPVSSNHPPRLARPLALPVLAAVLAALLAGCAVGPVYERPAIPVTVYKEAAALPPWKYARPADLDPQGRWWLAFGDAELAALIEEAGRSNNGIRVSAARYRQAVALSDAARAGLFPFVDASVALRRGTGSVNSGTGAGDRIATTRRLGLDAGWEADLWGRVRQQAAANRLAAEASAADLAAARLAVQAAVAQIYVQVRIADAEQTLLDSTVQAYERSLQLAGQRLRFGAATRGDVAQAEAQLTSTQAQAVDNRVQRARLEHALAVLLGREPAAFALPVRAPATVSGQLRGRQRVGLDAPVVPAGLPSSLLERRPDVAAAERRVAAANAAVGAAQAAYFPDLTLSASGGFQSSQAAGWLTLPNRVWSLGPALALPLLDGGARRARVDDAAAAYDATVAAYRQTVLDSVQEVEDALALLAGLERESALLDAAVLAARESERQMLARYQAGSVDYVGVVTVQATALAAERSALAAQGRRLAASVELIKALGGRWEAGKG